MCVVHVSIANQIMCVTHYLWYALELHSEDFDDDVAVINKDEN